MEDLARACNWVGFSINAGTAAEHEKITGSKPGTFDKIISNIVFMADYCREYEINCDLGYKYLITDDNYKNILTGIQLAAKIGIRHFQIRPADLPIDRAKAINKQDVEKQIIEGLHYERKNEFEVFGIREKFKYDYTKRIPWRCIASPLGSTWMATGAIVICPDRRFSRNKAGMSLGNFITEGLEAIRRKWGGPEHKRMIEEANKDIKNCARCTSIGWHDLYRETIIKDSFDITLI